MDIAYNKVDQTALPIDTTRVSASEYNQIAGSLMSIISASGITPDSADNTQLLNALKAIGSGWAMPSDVYEDLTLGASGSEYTAPSNGYVYFSKTSGAQYAYISLQNKSTHMSIGEEATTSITGLQLFLPVLKGHVFIVGYNATGATNYFRFIYAEGSKTEAN